MPDIRSEDREVQQYRTPPYSKEAEDGVLGALLIDNNTFDLIGGKIDSEDFYDYGNRLIFENIKRLLSQGKPADILTVHDILREGGLEKETGGLEYLNRLADYSPGAANVLRYAEIIRDRSIRRRLITTGNDIINDSKPRICWTKLRQKSFASVRICPARPAVSKKSTRFWPITRIIFVNSPRLTTRAMSPALARASRISTV